jgi:hypothetical protein
MKRDLQGHYITISTVGEKAQAFVPTPGRAAARAAPTGHRRGSWTGNAAS